VDVTRDDQALLTAAQAAQAAGKHDEALASYRQALASGIADSATSRVHYNIGKILLGLNRLDDAAQAYRAAIDDEPQLVDAYLDLGNIQQRQGKPWDAVETYRAILEYGPNAKVLVNISGLFHAFGMFTFAEASLTLAVRMAPDLAEAHNNLANLYRDKGDVAKAAEHYQQAVGRSDNPDYLSSLLFCLCFVEGADPETVYREHLAYNDRFIAPLRGRRRTHANLRDPDRKLRVGYISPDFRRHPGGHMLMPIFQHHDRTQFDVIAYSNAQQGDDRTEAMRAKVTEWRECATLSDDAVADRIIADRIDILVECTGHMAGTRLPLCGLKPAPIQISFPLYPNTTGVETMDYRLMDPYFAPEGAEAWHSEKIIRLPAVHVPYSPLPEDIRPADPPPFTAAGHVTFGSFNNLAKLGPATVAAWARILKEVPSARLRIKWQGVRVDGADWVTDRFAAHGIDAARIELAEYTPHPYTGYRDIDICLDPLFANGGTTTCDALWMGVPVVTKYGRTPFSRVGLCHLTNVGLTELIASDVDEYVRIAVDLATDRDRLVAVRRGLRERFARSPVMNGAQYTRDLETEYRRVWRAFCAAPPAIP
jgi:predicted O-linked N-acetylglucosamine transferase (SPINDLY family)